MNEIKCPHCGTVFTINETEYSQLLSQVRGAEFEKEIHERLARETELLEEKAKNDLQAQASDKDKEIAELTSQLEQVKQLQELDKQQALVEKDKKIADLEAQLDKLSGQQALELAKSLSEKDRKVQELQAQLDKQALTHENELQKSLASLEKEKEAVQSRLALQEKEAELQLTSVRSDYEVQLKAANEQVEFYKNFKAQQSTKAIGESLEIYAETEFNKVRNLAFPNAYFEKDNTVSSRGSKGDFIFREKDENGIEILSIMFEMKNEADGTVKKHKNEDFFKELDKDRREKKCEYAVLVTMLEADNDYYNTGIVDISHKYEKMYVVRPQFFIQLIGL